MNRQTDRGKIYKQKQRRTERKTDGRKKDKQTDRQEKKERQRQTKEQTDGQRTERKTDGKRERQLERQRAYDINALFTYVVSRIWLLRLNKYVVIYKRTVDVQLQILSPFNYCFKEKIWFKCFDKSQSPGNIHHKQVQVSIKV